MSSEIAGLTKVEELVKRYRFNNIYNPVIVELFQSARDAGMFWDSLSHEFKCIQKKSHRLDNYEINAGQKAFLVIRTEESNPIPAANIFLEQILGIGVPDASLKDVNIARDRIAISRGAFKLAHRQAEFSKQSQFHDTQQQMSSLRMSESFEPGEGVTQPQLTQDHGRLGRQEQQDLGDELPHVGVELAAMRTILPQGLAPRSFVQSRVGQHRDQVNEKDAVEGLEPLYRKHRRAKFDLERTRPRTFSETTAARFLRDTAENCLGYLAACKQEAYLDNEIERNLLDDFRKTVLFTTAIVERGSGGKKRTFEQDPRETPQGSRDIKKQHTSHDVYHRYASSPQYESIRVAPKDRPEYQKNSDSAYYETRHKASPESRSQVNSSLTSRTTRHHVGSRYHEDNSDKRPQRNHSLSPYSRRVQMTYAREAHGDRYRPAYR